MGYTKYKPINCDSVNFLEFEEFKETIKKSNIVITHAGEGSIYNALYYKRRTIIVPRLKKYKEHTNNHQLDLALAIHKKNFAISVFEIDDLEKAINTIGTLDTPLLKQSNIISIIEEFLYNSGAKTNF